MSRYVPTPRLLRTDEPDPEFPPPPKGTNAEFEELVEHMWRGLTATGNRESLTDETVRNTIARAVGENSGKRFEADR